MAIGNLHRGDNDGDEGMDGMPGDAPVRPGTFTTAAQAVYGVEHVIEMMDALRKDPSQLYFFAVGGTVVEHELGEALQATRKALLRLRKARNEMGEFGHMSLPLQ